MGDEAQADRLLGYLDLGWHAWNKVLHLTAVRDPAQMLTHHLLDSLAVVVRCGATARRRPARTRCWTSAAAAACPAWCWPPPMRR